MKDDTKRTLSNALKFLLGFLLLKIFKCQSQKVLEILEFENFHRVF